jgi:hypothetical protein
MFLDSITRWFARPARRPGRHRVPTTRLNLECLERREVPAVFGGLPLSLPTPPAALLAPAVAPQAVNLNSQIMTFCQQHWHLKVGGGECAHLANEALRFAGANFMPANNNDDYVWGTLVTTITHGRDSNSSARCQPGDIIQFQNVTMPGGWQAGQHTAIVAAVDSRGRPTQVYEQNVGVNGKGPGFHDRTERLDTLAINLNTILSGTVHIYRAAPRQDSPGQLMFSVVNDTTRGQTVTVYFNGVRQWTIPLDSVNTAGSYLTEKVSSTGGGTWSIGINGKSVRLSNAGGFEVFTANGQTSIRAI